MLASLRGGVCAPGLLFTFQLDDKSLALAHSVERVHMGDCPHRKKNYQRKEKVMKGKRERVGGRERLVWLKGLSKVVLAGEMDVKRCIYEEKRRAKGGEDGEWGGSGRMVNK